MIKSGLFLVSLNNKEINNKRSLKKQRDEWVRKSGKSVIL